MMKNAGDHVGILEYKNHFAKYIPHFSENVFVITKVKNTLPLMHVIIYLKAEEIFQTFYEKECQ